MRILNARGCLLEANWQELLSKGQEELLRNLEPSRRSLLCEHVEREGQQFVALDEANNKKESEIEQSAFASKYGGSFQIAEIPVDREGNPMQFFGQINFSHLPLQSYNIPEKGLFLFFLSKSYATGKPKERHWYKFVWLDSEKMAESSFFEPVDALP
ncbi:MAG: DUF1963 domain-containing protein [Cyanobacteria bacterium]|nr:DUF1963 domain-containing protein [Cyanobacteriota bacterium]